MGFAMNDSTTCTDQISLKLTGCTQGGVVNICVKFEVIWTKSNFMSNLGF